MTTYLSYLRLRPCTLIWLILLLLTVLAFVLGKLNLSGNTAMGVLLLTTIWKGKLIADYFMGLRQTRLLWRLLIWGWLLIVASAVSLAYSLA